MKKNLLLTFLACIVFLACKKQEVKEQNLSALQSSAVKNRNATSLSVTQTNVFNVTEKIYVSTEKDRLKNGYYLTDFSATGLYMAPGATLNITVQQTAGTRLPKLLIGTYSRYGTWNSQPASVQLTAGTNSISNPNGGLLWIRYTNSTIGSTAKVTFNSGFNYAPYYIAGVSNNADWINQLQTYTTPDVVLQGDDCFIVVSREKAIQYQSEDQTAILNKITQIIALEDELNGLDNSLPVHTKNVHKYLLTQHEDPAYYLFAYDYRTAYIGSAVNTIMTLNSVGTNGWGLWHELGHQHQMMWRWSTLGEVTVNLYSLYVQRALTPTIKRLVNDGTWPKAFTYLNKPAGTKDFNGSASYTNPLTDVFIRLCMFQQLTMAYGDDFYKNLAKQLRVENPTLSNDDAKLRYFMLKACGFSGKDLSNFFQKWGINLSTPAETTQIYADMAALGLPAPTMDPSILREDVPTTEISKTGWSVIAQSTQENGFPASNIIDQSVSTNWKSIPTVSLTHAFRVDMASQRTLNGFTFNQPTNLVNAVKTIEVQVSNSPSTNFVSVGTFTLGNNNNKQYFPFSTTQNARYFRLVVSENWDGTNVSQIAEVGMY